MKALIVLVMLLLIAACAAKQEIAPTPTPSGVETPSEPVAKGTQLTVEIGADGFNPRTITINQGDTVTWTNKDSTPHWVASALHPTHAVYPETGGCIGSKFDACKGLAQGESWAFTFNQKGQWGYHDHMNSDLRGKVIVQ